MQIIEDNDINAKVGLENKAMSKEEEVSSDDEGAILQDHKDPPKVSHQVDLVWMIVMGSQQKHIWHSKGWKEAAGTEYQSLQEIDLPQNCKPTGCKWVFKVKYDEMEEWNISREVW